MLYQFHIKSHKAKNLAYQLLFKGAVARMALRFYNGRKWARLVLAAFLEKF